MSWARHTKGWHRAVAFPLLVKTIPEQQRPHVGGGQQHVVLAAIDVPLILGHLHHDAAPVGVRVGADQDVGLALKDAGILLLERIDGNFGGSRVAGIRLLFLSGITIERREEPIEVIQPVGRNRLDVAKADVFEQARHRLAARPVKGAIGDVQRVGSGLLLRGQVRGEQETGDVLAVRRVDVDQVGFSSGIIKSRDPLVAAEEP